MCGIVWAKSLRGHNINDLLWQRYKSQSHRGKEGYGFLTLDSIVSEYRSKYESEIKQAIDSKKSSEILFHHRYPTSTPNIVEATHPILVSHKSHKYDYYIVHNGVISNCDELKPIHNELGFTYTTEILEQWHTSKTLYESLQFNDSESLAIELARYFEGKCNTIATVGSVAFIAIKVSKKSKKPICLYYGTNGGNPLKIKHNRKHIIISSEGEGVSVPVNTIFCYKYSTNEITKQKQTIGTYIDYSKQDWRDYDWSNQLGYQLPYNKNIVNSNKEEDDFSLMDYTEEYMELHEQLEELQKEKKIADKNNDYDECLAIQYEIEAVKVEIKSLSNKQKKLI